MEQSISSNTHIIHGSPSAVFTDDEIDIAYILLHLPNPIFYSESRYRFSVKWGNKRRRSAINLNPLPSPSLRVDMKTMKGHKIKNDASSPATPLSFSPSESDGKSKHLSKKVSKKRTREEWLGIIDRLMQQRELLRGDIDTVKGYYNKLKAFNLELKAKKEKIYLGNPHLEMNRSLDYEVKLNPHIIQSPLFQNQDHPQICSMIKQQPSIVYQAAYILSHSHSSENVQYPYGAHGIPDLNVVAAEETLGLDALQPLDHFRALAENRARAAEARRLRMVRIKEMKNSSSTIKPQQHFASNSVGHNINSTSKWYLFD